ncbi:MAG: hypothetical protein RI923_986, partial [Pseudomonadota bacterium]|jgi:uncharacterized protein YciI
LAAQAANLSMWYLVIAKDHPGTLAQRLASRADHLARLNDLDSQGRLKIAGPLPAIDAVDPGDAGFTGSALIVEFESIEDVRAWVSADPYFTAGVYASADIFPFKPVLP